MTIKSPRKKYVSLCFRGLEISPFEVESLVGCKASLILEKGKPMRPGFKTLAIRSAVVFKIEMESYVRFDEMIPKLISHLGGVDHLIKVRGMVKPEFFEIDFVLPVRSSKEQEGGALDMETIADIARLGASVAFGFF